MQHDQLNASYLHLHRNSQKRISIAVVVNQLVDKRQSQQQQQHQCQISFISVLISSEFDTKKRQQMIGLTSMSQTALALTKSSDELVSLS